MPFINKLVTRTEFRDTGPPYRASPPFRRSRFPPFAAGHAAAVLGIAASIALLVAAFFLETAAHAAIAASAAGVFLLISLAQRRAWRACRARLSTAEVTNRRLLARVHYLRGQARVLRAISRRQPLDDSLGILCRYVEARTPGARCSALILDSSGQRVAQSIAPGLPGLYNRALVGLSIGPRVGSCGAAMYQKQAVMISDVQSHPNWTPFRDLVQATGMRACWSTPILDKNDAVLGAFAVYHEESRLPTRAERLTIQSAVEMARIAISLDAVHRRLRGQSLRDELTGLANRRGMKEWLAVRLAGGSGVGLLLLDLDDFKPVNDTYGHAGGDKVLRVVAGRLRDLAGDAGIASRLGGDEFTLGIPGATLPMLEDTAARIIEAVGRPIAMDLEHQAHVRCSIGIALFPEDGETTEELMLHADQAMYVAKKSGKNQYRLWRRDVLSEQVDGLAQDGEQGGQEPQAQQDDPEIAVAQAETDERRDDAEDEDDQQGIVVKEHGRVRT